MWVVIGCAIDSIAINTHFGFRPQTEDNQHRCRTRIDQSIDWFVTITVRLHVTSTRKDTQWREREREKGRWARWWICIANYLIIKREGRKREREIHGLIMSNTIHNLRCVVKVMCTHLCFAPYRRLIYAPIGVFAITRQSRQERWVLLDQVAEWAHHNQFDDHHRSRCWSTLPWRINQLRVCECVFGTYSASMATN